MFIIDDTGEPPAQLDRRRQFATLFQGLANCGGISLGYQEHRFTMGLIAVCHKQRRGRRYQDDDRYDSRTDVAFNMALSEEINARFSERVR